MVPKEPYRAVPLAPVAWMVPLLITVPVALEEKTPYWAPLIRPRLTRVPREPAFPMPLAAPLITPPMLLTTVPTPPVSST
ncbi:hypothetical protein AZA_47531 [Nitrospirillum viridazoti Y2]|nr:hypothetical protein AZA_47531 [Nitrospirillum amazonense Y2]